MSQSVFTKTSDIQVLPWQSLATGAVLYSSVIDVATKLSGSMTILMGRDSATAFTAGWPIFRIETSPRNSGNDWFVPYNQFTSAVGASLAATTLSGAVSANASQIIVASASNIAVGDVLYIGHSASVTLSELARPLSISSTTITLQEPLANAHDNGARVSDQAESYYATINFSDTKRIRLVVDNTNSGRTIYIAARMTTCDSIGFGA